MEHGVSAHLFGHWSSWVPLSLRKLWGCGCECLWLCMELSECQHFAFNPSPVSQNRAVSVYIQIASSSKEWPMAPMASVAKESNDLFHWGICYPGIPISVPGQILKEQVKWVYWSAALSCRAEPTEQGLGLCLMEPYRSSQLHWEVRPNCCATQPITHNVQWTHSSSVASNTKDPQLLPGFGEKIHWNHYTGKQRCIRQN